MSYAMKTKIVLLSTIGLLIVCSCDKEQLPPQDKLYACETTTALQQMVLGEKLENPYSVSNMKAAYESLSKCTRLALSSDEAIYPTHYYVKFIPKDEAELSLLKVDSTLILFPYPLDYDIIKFGSYRDPNIPESQPTPLYCSIPVNKEIPKGVEYLILEELFIPDDASYGTLTRSSDKLSASVVRELVSKSMELTSNVEQPTTRAGSSWVPNGTITYWNGLQSVPIEGLQVRCNRWFTTYTAYTDANGHFQCLPDETFSGAGNYSIVYERYDFEIRDAWLSTARTDGPKISGTWNKSLYDSEESYYGTIFRAAYRYYYQDIHGLCRPPKNSTWNVQLKIKASLEYDGTTYGSTEPGRRYLGLGSMIHINTYSPNTLGLTTYATTIHELTHAAHWQLTRDDASFVDMEEVELSVVESWARGVQWFLTKDIYPSYMGEYPGDYIYGKGHLTNVVIDLIDGPSDHNYGEGNPSNDYVSGLNIVNIQNALQGCISWNEWKDNIISYYTDYEQAIKDIFDYWRNAGHF